MYYNMPRMRPLSFLFASGIEMLSAGHRAVLSRQLGSICALAMLCGSVSFANGPSSGNPSQQYAEAKRLSRAGQYAQAETLLSGALSNAVSRGDDYYAFYFARDLSRCREHRGNNTASLQDALLALDYLKRQTSGSQTPMPFRIQMYEQAYLEGLVTKFYYNSHRVSQARQWHEKANRTLAALIKDQTGTAYDLLSGIKPAGVSEDISCLIPRQLWMESIILESEARTTKALERLETAERYLKATATKRNAAEENYYLKVLNRKAMLLDFLGWLPEAIAIDRRLAGMEPTRANTDAIQGARMNLNRNLSQYYGPSESYVKEAMDACQVLNGSADGQYDLSALRLVNKMVFDLTHDPNTQTNLASIQTWLKQAGQQKDAEYTERDQLEIQIRTGDTQSTEKRLLTLIESFRDNGNRTGEVTLFRDYADLCYQLKRYDEAVYLYTRTLELSKSYGWHVHLPAVMAKLARTYLAKGDTARADEWIQEIRNHLKSHPDIPAHRQADALVKVAELLDSRGRGNESAGLKNEILAYCRKSGVPDFWIGGLQQVAMASKQSSSASPPPPVKTAAAETLQTDLQPRDVQSRTLPDETALAGFALANPSGSGVSGRLIIPDSIALTEWDKVANVIRLQVNPRAARKPNQPIPITLEPSGLIRLSLCAQAAANDDCGTVELKWLPDGGQPQSSKWTYATKQETSDITVVNANLVELNPFYFVPIQHAIRKRGTAERLFDYTAVSSAPCHVEIVDAANGAILAVDRQGDGMFDKEGDFIFQDSNGNLYPDHTFAADEDLYYVELRVYPTGASAPSNADGITVTFMGAFGDQWHDLAEDILTARQPH